MSEPLDDLDGTIANVRIAMALLYAARVLDHAHHGRCGALLRGAATDIGRGVPAATEASFDDEIDDEFSTVVNRTTVRGSVGMMSLRTRARIMVDGK